MYSTGLYCTLLYSIVLYWTKLNYVLLHCILTYSLCILIDVIVLTCTLLFCVVVFYAMHHGYICSSLFHSLFLIFSLNFSVLASGLSSSRTWLLIKLFDMRISISFSAFSLGSCLVRVGYGRTIWVVLWSRYQLASLGLFAGIMFSSSRVRSHNLSCTLIQISISLSRPFRKDHV